MLSTGPPDQDRRGPEGGRITASMEVATGAEAAKRPPAQGIGDAIKALAAIDAGFRPLPADPYDAFAAVDLEADAAVTLCVLVGVLEKDLAFVRGLYRKDETSVVK